MTRFAPSQVISCPHCQHLALRERLSSLNSFGATKWSDGYIGGLFRFPFFTRCARCQGVFWLDDAEIVGMLPEKNRARRRKLWPQISHWLGIARSDDVITEQQVPEEWWWANPVSSPDTDALLIGLESMTDGQVERALALRRLLWWQFNQRHRWHAPTAISVSATVATAHEQSNLLRLLELTACGETNQGLERTELLRALGWFDEAREALNQVNSDTVGVAVIAARIAARDSKVCIIHEESW